MNVTSRWFEHRSRTRLYQKFSHICCAPPKNTAAELRLWLVNTIFQQFSRAPRITYVSSAKVVKFSAECILYMACISRTTKPRANIFYLILIKSFSVCVFAICTLFKSEMIFFFIIKLMLLMDFIFLLIISPIIKHLIKTFQLFEPQCFNLFALPLQLKIEKCYQCTLKWNQTA